VDDLLNMRSGIDVAEDYTTLWAPIVKMYLTTDLGRFIGQLNGLRFEPGTRFEYRSVDSQVLGIVLNQATGVPISSYLSRELWSPLGAEHAAKWNVDSAAHHTEKTFCCFNATARDFAKVGSLYLHRGQSNGQQLIDASWVDRLSNPIEHDRQRSLGYSNNWWIPPDNTDGDFSAIGIHGQFIYVNPRRKTVIVKLSEHEIEQDVLLTLSTFQRIARQLDKADPRPPA
jgi:CubicO group peptidase (beta-lactamase class C family)